MMKQPIDWLMSFWMALIFSAGPVAAPEPYYQGKTVRVIVVPAVGGGFDTYSRAIGRQMGRHIPGNPTMVVENRPGAAHLIAANHIYKVPKPDGLTIGNFGRALFLGQVIGRAGIEFDACKFHYLGAPSRDLSICALSKKSGLASLQQWQGSKTWSK